MIFIVLGIAIALLCYRMGIIIGRLEMQEEFNKVRDELSLEKADEFDQLFKE